MHIAVKSAEDCFHMKHDSTKLTIMHVNNRFMLTWTLAIT